MTLQVPDDLARRIQPMGAWLPTQKRSRRLLALNEDGALVVPLTAQGRVTVKIFQLNHPHRIAERLRLPEVP